MRTSRFAHREEQHPWHGQHRWSTLWSFALSPPFLPLLLLLLLTDDLAAISTKLVHARAVVTKMHHLLAARADVSAHLLTATSDDERQLFRIKESLPRS